mmetsp:Transcript_42674/g.72666  ORF Transcript_42674/g.72666 Transcript_42674/m.72666 type:complete len:202 (-) Transcript_42674:98-703(-)
MSNLLKSMIKKKPSVGELPEGHVQEEAPTGAHDGEEVDVAHLGQFNPNVEDHSHIKKSLSRGGSMALPVHMKPKEDKWSHVTKAHAEEEEDNNDDISTLELLKYKAMLYGTMGKLRGDIEYCKYLIKLKKRQFGVDVYHILEEDGKVGQATMDSFATFKTQIQELNARVKKNEADLVRLSLSGESEEMGIAKPTSPRLAKK